MDGIKEMLSGLSIAITPKLPPQLEVIKTCICEHPLINRITVNWKIILMDATTIMAISCLVLTFLNGSAFLCTIFALVSMSSGISSFYMRRFEELRDIEETAQGLRDTRERFEILATTLEQENTRLRQTNEAFIATNQELQNTNTAFLTTNQQLQTTNNQLTQQVTGLTLQATQLRESSERIRQEMTRFQTENAHLYSNVQGLDQSLRVLDQQIVASRELCSQVTNHLSTQQEGLGQQLTQLGQYLNELRSDNGVVARIQQVNVLHQQALQATNQLRDLQVQYAQERGNFQGLHQALQQIQTQFSNSVETMSNNNENFRLYMNTVVSEGQRIQQFLNRILPNTTTGNATSNANFLNLPSAHPIVVN